MIVTTFFYFGDLEPLFQSFDPFFQRNSQRLTIAFTALDLFLWGAIVLHSHLDNFRLIVPPLYACQHLPFHRSLKSFFNYLGISEALSHVSNLSVQVLPYLPGYVFPLSFGLAAFASWESLMPTEGLCLPRGIPTMSYYRSRSDLFTHRPHWGYFVPHVRDAIGVGSFYTSGLGVSLLGMLNPNFNSALTVVNNHFRQPSVTKLSQRFTRVNPSNLSLALFRLVVSR